MNYGELNNTILPKIERLTGLINNIEVDPTVRRRYMEQLYRTVGNKVYTKIYDMNAWDMLIDHTTGLGIDNRHYGLAKITAGAPVTNLELSSLIGEYLDSVSGKAQYDAMQTAKDSGKVPQMKRNTKSKKPCIWCKGKDTGGNWIDYPDRDNFNRHSDCSCEIHTRGYNSRNGLLNNYKVRKRDYLREQDDLV